LELWGMESDRDRALRILQDADLAHPSIPLLETFLNDAVDGDQAARYLLETYADGKGDTDFTNYLGTGKIL
ncbi:hypothetical protein BKA65DRAFT_385634, partial [Rhexocercosporidium sp. MPI-PUGE-AT-0058]